MAGAATENELSELHRIVARGLADRLASGEASAADYSNAIKMLKDNNITCAVEPGSAVDELQKALEDKGKRPVKVNGLDLADALDAVEFTQGQMN